MYLCTYLLGCTYSRSFEPWHLDSTNVGIIAILFGFTGILCSLPPIADSKFPLVSLCLSIMSIWAGGVSMPRIARPSPRGCPQDRSAGRHTHWLHARRETCRRADVVQRLSEPRMKTMEWKLEQIRYEGCSCGLICAIRAGLARKFGVELGSRCEPFSMLSFHS